MPDKNKMKDLGLLIQQMRQWRHQIHRHPEIAFTEYHTAELVARTLRARGIEAHEGIADTGVVGVLRKGSSERSLALRADMDALQVQELNDFEHKSEIDGKMHACGHDGHTAMLLGAACYLADKGVFDGTVYFIFQPAEENEGGGRRMIDEGLFQRFPADAVYGLHNLPGLAVGHFSICAGPMMAGFATFECVIQGQGGHSAMPHLAKNPIMIGNDILTGWTQVREAIQADIPVNMEVTMFNAGEASNTIPETATIGGSVRCFDDNTNDRIKAGMRAVVNAISTRHGVSSTFDYQVRYPVLVNNQEKTAYCADVAADLVGQHCVESDREPVMASEDFAYMLQARPGAYILIGNGEGEAGGCMVHNPHYDFNDDILGLGANYFVGLVENSLQL
ncbi:MAG: amidohydrolase [Proteobacteria bacterium]|nr:amidohydrolase [Pseudomonadota bacterium]